jgi:hypothetical protein
MFSGNSHSRLISTRDAFFSNISPIPLAPLTPIPHPIIHSFHIDDINVSKVSSSFTSNKILLGDERVRGATMNEE